MRDPIKREQPPEKINWILCLPRLDKKFLSPAEQTRSVSLQQFNSSSRLRSPLALYYQVAWNINTLLWRDSHARPKKRVNDIKKPVLAFFCGRCSKLKISSNVFCGWREKKSDVKNINCSSVAWFEMLLKPFFKTEINSIVAIAKQTFSLTKPHQRWLF